MIRLLVVLLLAGCAGLTPVAEVRAVLGDDTRYGSAVLVQDGWWLTNAHVVRGLEASQIAVGPLGVAGVHPVTGVATWGSLHVVVDGALLETRGTDLVSYPVRAGRWSPVPGEAVTVVTRRGSMAGVMRPATGQYQVAVDGEVVPGDSGGAVLDEEGRLVGLIWASSATREHVGLVTPVWAIRQALQDLEKGWVLR